MGPYYLIQQAKVRKVADWNKIPRNERTLIKCLSLEYMGSAEFEWGAVPRAIMKFMCSPGQKVLETITVRINDEEQVFRVFVRKEQLDMLKQALENWPVTSRMLKERVSLDGDNLFLIGIDKGREFMLTRSKIGKRAIVENLPTSYTVLKNNPTFNRWMEGLPEEVTFQQILDGLSK